MEYPVWQLTATGGGFWIALIATLHVFVAQFAVGGGLFLVLTEMRARRLNSPQLLDFVRRHTGFFLLLTMVFGALSGVGIWFIISVLAPAATATLISHFVWGWAAEWVFFLGEILALLVYHYSFERMAPRQHVVVGWLYFLFAWLSLVIINGIIGVMLTPGTWLHTGNFWEGIFNPSFWSSVTVRTALSVLLAGLFGFLTALRIQYPEVRLTTMRICALWAGVALPALFLAGIWFMGSLPVETSAFILQKSREITPWFRLFPLAAALIIGGCLFLSFHLGRASRIFLATLALVGGFLFVAGFEFVREAGRKPWIIHGHTWAQGVQPKNIADIHAPFLPKVRWAQYANASSWKQQGQELFLFQCLPCHSVGGPMNNIRKAARDIPALGVEALLKGQGRLFPYMPPFLGDNKERQNLAAWVASVNGQKEESKSVPVFLRESREKPASFDAETDEYVLLAWNTLGMKCISDADAFFSILPPGSAVEALVLRRGPNPELLQGDEVEIFYEAPQEFLKPAEQVDFWEYTPSLLGKKLVLNESATGKGLRGKMDFRQGRDIFTAVGIPVVPYTQEGEVQPYPVFTIKAVDKNNGKILAHTKVVVPVSTEMGCKDCHGGEWRREGSGISALTAQGILQVHDKHSGTTLVQQAKAGQPVLCQSCHEDPLLQRQGKKGLLSLSAAIHGFHANYMTGEDATACARCHPDSPSGVTRCLRGSHANKGFTCDRCHGFLEDHALSLLKREKEMGKAQAEHFMAHLKPRLVSDRKDINPRTSWKEEPDCASCHDQENLQAETAIAFNHWVTPENLYRNRKDAMGVVPCIACHGAPHSLYPAKNAYGLDRDNLQPLQYTGQRGPLGSEESCAMCHQELPAGDAHHLW